MDFAQILHESSAYQTLLAGQVQCTVHVSYLLHFPTSIIFIIIFFPQKKTPDVKFREAALWSARYLSFTAFLGEKPKHSINETTLSVLSELEPNDLMVDLLAHCFPSSDTSNPKLARLVNRLRSTVSVDSESLAVHYQIKCNEINKLRHEMFGEPKGLFRELILTQAPSYLIEKEALKTGSLMFEYDIEFIKFLDSVYSVILPDYQDMSFHSPLKESSFLTLSQLHSSSLSLASNPQSPMLSKYLNKVQKSPSEHTKCWEQIIPLVEVMHTWCITNTQQVQPLRSQQLPKKKSKKSDLVTDSSPRIKVSLSPNVVLEALKQRESLCFENEEEMVDGAITEERKVKDESISNPPADSEVSGVEQVMKSPETGSNECSPVRSSDSPRLFQLPPGTLQVLNMYIHVYTYIPL